MPTFKDKEDFVKQTNVRAEKNQELIKFARDNLNHLPFTEKDGGAWENYERMISGMLYNCLQKNWKQHVCLAETTCWTTAVSELEIIKQPKNFLMQNTNI